MRIPLEPGPDHVENWLDRIGHIVFISDEAIEIMAPQYYAAALREHDQAHGHTEAAVWWM